ncbi:hypothetical protein EDD15DRAFT_2271840 [Pisolithus albus]|nr:hypothetical protein EDD15DRAFT_2271840 [Pisolithus albus]
MASWDHLDEEDHVANREWNTVMGPMNDPDPFGILWIYSTETESLSRVALANYPEGHDFHLLGIDVYPSKAGAPSNLFLVNHALRSRPAQPTVATHVRTLTSSYFVAPNSVSLTILSTIGTIGRPPLTWVAHITVLPDDSFEHKFAALGIAFANGVALSRDGLHIAVTSSSLAKVHFYRCDPSTNDLTLDRAVTVPFGLDNVMYDDDDTLNAAGHPHFPSFVAVVENKPGAKAPSWAVFIRPIAASEDGESEGQKNSRSKNAGYDTRAPLSASVIAPASSTDETETMFQSDSSVYETATTGLIDSRTGIFYLMGLYEDGVLVCYPGSLNVQLVSLVQTVYNNMYSNREDTYHTFTVDKVTVWQQYLYGQQVLLGNR